MPAPRLDPRATVRALYVLIFLFVGGYGNFFPLWLNQIGLTETDIGWLDGMKYLSLVFWPLVWGLLADRWGSPHAALRLICVGSAVCFLPVLAVSAFVPLLATMVVYSAFRVGVVSTTDSLTLAHIQADPSEDYGRIRSWGSAGFIVGGFLLAGLVTVVGRAAIPWALVALLSLTAVVALLGSAGPSAVRGVPTRTAARSILGNPTIRRLLVVTFVNRVAANGLYIFLPLHLQNLGVLDSLIPVYWALGVLSEIALLRMAPRLFGSRAPRTLLCVCFAFCVVQYALTALISSPWLLLPVMLMHGVTFGVWYYTCVLWLGKEVEPEVRTTAQALFQSVGFGLGGTISAIGAGYLFQAGQGALLFGVAAALSAVTLCIAWALLPGGGSLTGPE